MSPTLKRLLFDAIDPIEVQHQALVAQLRAEMEEFVETEHATVHRIVARLGAVADFEEETLLTLFSLHWVIAKIKLRLATLCPLVPIEAVDTACMEIARDFAEAAQASP